jgi:type II secretory pathway pseudopilin PulG
MENKMLHNIRNLSQVRLLKTYIELQKLARKNSQEGFTIIESLMAIIVVTVLLVGITPPIFLAVGTRVQNQRAEQAMQLAQLEIDRVRVLMERGDFAVDQLPPSGGAGRAEDVAAPQNFSATSCGTDTGSSPTCSVDVNEKIPGADFYIQRFRTRELLNGGQVIAFNMGVRVYSSAAAQNPFPKGTEEASLKMTSADGSQRRLPLAVIYTVMASSDDEGSLGRYRDMLR